MSDTDLAPADETAKRDYLPAERQDMILSLLTRQSVATVPELAQLLNTTEITVRRDLTVLAKAGLLKRVRGGAMSVSDTAERIATKAALNDISSVVSERTDSGTTVRAVDGRFELPSDQPAIGVMLPEPSFFWPGVINHMHEIATRMGLRLITRESAYEEDIHEENILQEFADDPTVCGLIVAPNAHPEIGQRTWDWIARAALPTVAVERSQPLLQASFVDSVRTNHHYGVRKAATHFLERGHTRVGAAFTETPTSNQILTGWKRVVNGTDRIDCPFIIDGIMPYDTRGVDDIVATVLSSNVTALLVHSDYLAIALAQALERHGKKVPQDISLISVDGFATPSSRPLTVLRSSDRDLAQAAIHTLLHRIQNPEAAARHVYIDPMLVDRGSVVPPPTHD
ncbi:substrate-binding domain-containing protein [Bifidobacterium eulemuris]|nr:substrate-binding domain-containing protein [Bifidobacterium eulemuris]QOL32578.1 DeoR/GlpR family transcriptional regulator [Bifidobacterium eulemuris]